MRSTGPSTARRGRRSPPRIARLFLRIALGEGVALVGFVITFAGGPRWTYFVAAALALAQLWATAAPTRAAIARDQHKLALSGCGLSLVEVLQTGPEPLDPARR